MNGKELANDYAFYVKNYLEVAFHKFLNDNSVRNDSKLAFFTLIEKPVYSLIKNYTERVYDWKNIYDEAVLLSNDLTPDRFSKSMDFLKKRGFPVDGLEAKISKLSGLSSDEFYQAYFKITEVADIINKLFDNISFMVLGTAYEGNFIF